MKRLLITAVLVSFWSATAVPALAGVSVKEINKGSGITHLQVTNEYFDMEFAPERGAQALSFKTRYSPNEWVYWTGSDGYGLFIDHFVGQAFPGELVQAKYEFRVVERGPDRVIVEFQTLTKDNIRYTRN